jgi:hypothetical protein
LLDNVYEAETKEIEWNMHEIRRRQGHQPQYADHITNDLRLNILRDLLLLDSKAASLFSVECTRLSDKDFGKLVGHSLLVLEKDIEEVASEDGEVFLLKELRVNLGEGVEARVHLVFWDRALVANQTLELSDFVFILSLKPIYVLLRDLDIGLELKDVD